MRRTIAMGICFFVGLLCFPPVFAEQTMPLVRCASVVCDSMETEAEYCRRDGRECFFLKDTAKKLTLRAEPAEIAEETENIALRIVYLDNASNFIRVRWRARSTNIVERTRLIHKSSSGNFCEAVVLIHKGLYDGGNNGADIIIDSYDTHGMTFGEYISEVELINLSTMGTNEEAGQKKHILFRSVADILNTLGLQPQRDAKTKVSLSDANAYFEKITGIRCEVREATMGGVIREWLETLGYPINGNLQNRAIEAGLVRSVGYAPAFFGRSGYEMQNFGVATVTYTDSQSVFYDDLSGLLYNLLFMKKNGEELPFMVQLAQKDETFEDKLLGLNDTLISGAYYDAAGIKISEKEITDSVTGNVITGLYMKGANINSTYVNEYASADGENYLLCAAYDKRLNAGIPVLYNRRTKKTTELSQTRNVSPFAMMMSRQNIAYWTEEDSLYAYDIATGEKEKIFIEPDGKRLQDVPTITNDGKYITVFCGKKISYQPNVIYRIETETKNYQILIDEAWTEEHFSGSKNPFLGHVIINPENPEIVNFMHGGGDNVTDRLWLYEKGNIYQPYVQQMKSNGSFGEHITHAFWSLNGKRLYFLRPPASSETVENGIAYIDIAEKGKPVHVLNGDYSYIHTSVDATDKHFVSDTQIVFDRGRYRNEIVLYSDVSKNTMLLAYVPVWKSHPCHSHTTFTADGKNVIFNMAAEGNNNCMVGIVNVEKHFMDLDNGKQNRNGEFAWLSASEESGIIGMLPTEDAIDEKDGETCLKVADNLSFEVLGSFVPKNESTVSVVLTYFDEGAEPFYLQYNSNMDSEYGSIKNKKQLSISKTDTGQWKQKMLVLEDACLRSANADNSDVVLLAGNDGVLYLRQIVLFTGTGSVMQYSTPTKKDGKLYVPILNPQAESKTLWVLTGKDGSYSLTEILTGGDLFITAEVNQTDYDKFFVWENNLCPIDRRGS